jgi:uncharacterized damage-inducible protein DinB
MSVPVDFNRLMDYVQHERGKWKTWLEADPSRLRLPFQPGARFPTINSLIDHVFWVERRHLCRLQGAPLVETTGVAEGDIAGLFAFADRAHADLRQYVAGLTDAQAGEVMSWTAPAPIGPLSMTRGKLAIHILLHEVRHMAQLAYAARLAGVDPPGQHDYFAFPEGAAV